VGCARLLRLGDKDDHANKCCNSKSNHDPGVHGSPPLMGCRLLVNPHAAALGHYWNDEDKLKSFIDDYRTVDLFPRKRVMLDYAHKLTTAPHAMVEADVQQLRECELADEDILAINLIASYFNFVNRIALGLGVAFNPDEVEGYKY
jgi:uncharacterized peroxidase-related enzyme